MNPMMPRGAYDYGFNHGLDAESQEVIMLILAMYAVIFGILALFGLANYLLKAFGMYGMAKKQNVKNPWLAFIPIASNYLQGSLSGEFNVGKNKVKNPGLWMLLGPLIANVIMGIVITISMIVMIVSTIANANMNPEGFPLGMGYFGSLGVMVLFSIAASAFIYAIQGIIRYHIHKKYVDESLSVIHMILGLFIPLYQAIYFFILRNRTPQGMEAAYASHIVQQEPAQVAEPQPQQAPQAEETSQQNNEE